ncbi:TPA: DEAD/DEAH box helicase family protein [Proteus mirabilis]|nr:DEAD/DEAH box helicase family protein [Proteus mirabilis]
MGDVSSVAFLRSTDVGGTVSFEVDQSTLPDIERLYSHSMSGLSSLAFWRAAANGTYRPEKGLWLPQRRAVAFAHAYLAAWDIGVADGQAALVKMPTGTGKSAVIATLACVSPRVKKILILTPCEGLVSQMRFDLSFRFWGKAFGAVYDGDRLRENVDQVEIERIAKAVTSGRIAPARVLEAAQYAKIIDDADTGKDRQILVGTFNALHRVLGLEPPPHRDFQGRKAPKPATSLSSLPGGIDSLRTLLHNVDLVIVDEGHYEPAYAWSQAVRALGRPTIIFSATPYRNDYKYFKIDGGFVFNLPWDEAVSQRLIREVRVEPPLAVTDTPPTNPTREELFVHQFRTTFAALPADKKVIVHAATFRSLAALQAAIHGILKQSAVLIHDIATKGSNATLGLDGLSETSTEQLKLLRFEKVRTAVKNDQAKTARIWLHQYKLLEGFDDPRVVEIWLLDPFGSARQLVQQIGRATRLPDLDDPVGQCAIVRGSNGRIDCYVGAPTVHEQIDERWQNYLDYERYAAKEVDMAFRAETQLLANVKRAAPAVQYIAREFRVGHLLDETPSMTAFILPRRASVHVLEGMPKSIKTETLDELARAFREAMLLEERFDISDVLPPAGLEADYADVRMIRYLLWSNSRYLAHHHIPEWRLGVAIIARAGPHIFLLDTEGVPIDKSRLKLLAPPTESLRRLFPDTKSDAALRTRIVETAAAGLDLGERGLRSLRVRRHAMETGYFDLAEASQVPTSISGIAPHDGGTARRRLSLRTSSVTDSSYAFLTVEKWLAWVRLISVAMTAEKTNPHPYFRRFAHDVPPPTLEKGKAKSILLDLWGVVDEVASEEADAKGWDESKLKALLDHDTCCEVKDVVDDNGKVIGQTFEFGPFQLSIEYIYRGTTPLRGRYKIEGDKLDQSVTGHEAAENEGVELHEDDREFGRKLPSSLIRIINQQQSFRVIPVSGDCVYSTGHFYKPNLSLSMLEILECSVHTEAVKSEKGDTRVESVAKWNTETLFGLVFGWLDGSLSTPTEQFGIDLIKSQVVICDDSTIETADFYTVDPVARRVMLIHAKASKTRNPEASAGKLQDVTRQAQASLAFAGSAGVGLAKPPGWDDDWSVKLKDAPGVPMVKRSRLLKGPATINEAHKILANALADPSYRKEVVMMTSGLLSSKAAQKAFTRKSTQDLQFLYFLAGARTAFDRAGVRYRIICNP